MNFKEKYKKIKNFKKIINRPISLFYLFIVIMLSNLGYSIYHNYNLHINYNYQPAKEYIDIDNLNISYQLFHIENNDQIIYDSDRIYSIIDNKFQEIETNILIETNKFTEKNFATNYLKYADKDEIKFSAMTKFPRDSTIFSELYSNSLFFEKNSEYIIHDNEKNISQSKIKMNQNYYDQFDSLIKTKNDSEYILYKRVEDQYFVIEKQKEKFIFTLFDKENSLISKLFVIEKDGDIFISQSDNTLSYSTINIQKNIINIKEHLNKNIFLHISSFSFLFFLFLYGFTMFLTNLFLYIYAISYVKKKNKNIDTIKVKESIKKEIKYVE